MCWLTSWWQKCLLLKGCRLCRQLLLWLQNRLCNWQRLLLEHRMLCRRLWLLLQP